MYTPRHPIPQPPHSAGLAYKGLRAAIDPHAIPSPVEAIELDKERWESEPFMTLPGNHVPISTTDYVAIDQGNSSPRFLRVSTWNVPSTSRLASECEIPIAAIIQPFADQDPREEPVPLVETGDMGPARCAGCRGYINPWCKWVSGGTKWKCNLCGHETEVSPEYFCNLDANFMRLDHLQRPELNKGTVDFIVPEAYWAPHSLPNITSLYEPLVPESRSGLRQPQPMDYVFAFDVSSEATRSRFTAAACSSLLDLLYGRTSNEASAPTSCLSPGSRICIISFDRTLHFYDLAPHDDRIPPMLVVPDVEDVYVPLKTGLFVDPQEARNTITKLLSSLGQVEDGGEVREAALGSALIGGLAALSGRGGQVVVFAATLPTVGAGALTTPAEESTLYGTDKEKSLFLPRSDTWRELGEQCAQHGIGVSMFLGMSKPIDVASIGVVASVTGGELSFYPRFDPARDATVLGSQLRRLLARTTAYNCTMRVRCSNGLRVSKYYGNFYESAAADLQFGTLDADKAVSVSFDHGRTLDEREYAYIQCAVLYTTASGQRRVRVMNLALQVAALAGSIFRYADMDTVVCHMVREAISKLPSQRILSIQETLTETCSSILLAYRKHCAASQAPSQLIIPEAFRALPVYTLAMMKSKPLKGRNVIADVRNYSAHKIMSMGVRTTMQHLYPRLLALHDLQDNVALPDPTTGQIEMPSLMRASHLFMEGHGLYLIDNEEQMIIWIGNSVSPQLLKDLFDVDDIFQVDPHMVRLSSTQLPALSTRFSTQVRNILAYRHAQRGWQPKLLLARQNMDAAEIEFSDMLVEDQNNAAMSYLDYLCLVHKQINAALTSGASLGGGSGFRGAPW
ncbi:sec24-like protein [Obba rivulosa]|uniref:Sec24-like protein n=1 Tax=Obba rivulosa TaxID=1052685 RepID=A0A8E2ARW4_9APHY|nr:sec24-like protein [Obba rivulosa]